MPDDDTPPGLWCREHWDAHRAARADRRRPVNELLLGQQMGAAWHHRIRSRLGDATPTDPATLTAMMEADLPLCCHLGDDTLNRVRAGCVLPPMYRTMPQAAGWRLHLLAVMSRGRVHAED